MRVALLIVAAGSGNRFGDPTPKQFLELDGKALVQYAIEAWKPASDIDFQIHCVFQKSHEEMAQKTLKNTQKQPVFTHFFTSKTRQQSVHLGLEAMSEFAPDVVLIHDAARPFMPSSVFDTVLETAIQTGAACASLPLVDAIHIVDNGKAQSSIDKAHAVRAQTPQGFDYTKLRALHKEYEGQDFGDDVGLAQASGLFATPVAGSDEGLKVTTKMDLAVLKQIRGNNG